MNEQYWEKESQSSKKSLGKPWEFIVRINYVIEGRGALVNKKGEETL